MPRYLVYTKESLLANVVYTVEAESVEAAQKIVIEGDVSPDSYTVDDDYMGCDSLEIQQVIKVAKED